MFAGVGVHLQRNGRDYRLGCNQVYGRVCGLVCNLVCGLVCNQVYGLVCNLVCGLVCDLVCGRVCDLGCGSAKGSVEAAPSVEGRIVAPLHDELDLSAKCLRGALGGLAT
jgi:hypothetical protein